MIRVMLDSDQLDALSDRVPLNATYADLVPHAAELRSKFPNSQIVLIDRGLGDPEDEATIIDVETGTHTPGEVPGWLDRKEKSGKRDLMVYMNRSTMPAVDDAAKGMKFSKWVATLDGTAFLDGHTPLVNPTAMQILGSAMVGVHADMSLVYDENWMRAPESDWLTQARHIAAALLDETQHADGTAGQLAKLISQGH